MGSGWDELSFDGFCAISRWQIRVEMLSLGRVVVYLGELTVDGLAVEANTYVSMARLEKPIKRVGILG